MKAHTLTMQGRERFGLQAKVSVLPAGSTESWVEMAYEGTWKGHQSGEFSFDLRKLTSVIDNFRKNQDLLPVYYGHPRHDLGLKNPAAGWIKDLEIRKGSKGNELWGLVEWTTDAAAGIRKGEYRYCSVVIDFSPVDRVTGLPAGEACLYELGLTGSAFLPGMTPITLSRIPSSQWRLSTMDPKKILDQISKALGLPNTATPDQMAGAFTALVALWDALNPEAEAAEPPDAVDGEVVDAACAPKAITKAKLSALKELAARMVKLADVLPTELLPNPDESPQEQSTDAASTIIFNKLLDASKLSEVDLLAAVTEKLDQLVAVLTAAPTASMSTALSAHKDRAVALAAQVNELQSEVTKLSAERSTRLAAETVARISASFSRLIGEGRVTESQRDVFVKASTKDEKGALEIYESLPAIQPPMGTLAVGLSASPVKAPGVTNEGQPLDENDNEVRILRLSARGQGLKGVHIDNWVRKALNLKHAHSV